MKNYNCLVVLGPTASGKTSLACQLALKLNGEIISVDSRQVYKFLDIGTGKDLNEYNLEGQKIKYHLIDLIDPTKQFYLHQFISELQTSFESIIQSKKLPIICGGTGLYLDALRKDFSLTQIKEDPDLRASLENLSKEDLEKKIKNYPPHLITHVDLNSKKRLIRGIEIAEHLSNSAETPAHKELPYKPFYIGINVERETSKQLISQRLTLRLENGLIEEVQGLLNMGLTEDRLNLLGLEYKFVLAYLKNEFSKEELFIRLETAIFQFAKRQMTWFRRMEKEGVEIYWINRDYDLDALSNHIAQE